METKRLNNLKQTKLTVPSTINAKVISNNQLWLNVAAEVPNDEIVGNNNGSKKLRWRGSRRNYRKAELFSAQRLHKLTQSLVHLSECEKYSPETPIKSNAFCSSHRFQVVCSSVLKWFSRFCSGFNGLSYGNACYGGLIASMVQTLAAKILEEWKRLKDSTDAFETFKWLFWNDFNF